MNTVANNTVCLDGLNLFYREAGSRKDPTILLLHGFPNSSFMFRDVIRPLAEQAHVIAPDMPGYGFSDSPLPSEFSYTFDSLMDKIHQLLARLEIEKFFIYLHDFGCPVGYLLALREPERILGLIVQNGNSHMEGLGDIWKQSFEYWADPTEEKRSKFTPWMTPEGTRGTICMGHAGQADTYYPPGMLAS